MATAGEESCSSPGVRLTANPYRHARNLSGWRREILQLAPGEFAGRTGEAGGDGFFAAEEFLSRAAFHAGPAYPGGLTLGVLAGIADSAIWNGQRIDAERVLCTFGDLEMLLRTHDNASLSWLSVPHGRLEGYAALRSGIESQRHGAALCLHDRELADAIRRLVARPLSGPGETLAWPSPAAGKALAMADAFVCRYLAAMPELSVREGHAVRVVRAVRSHLLRNAGASIAIPDLCAVAATSERTLRNASETVTGESPVAFLRAMRLNQVRRCLLSAATPVRITEIGMKWGFLHMPQFSRDYRALFGELPSETIRRQLATGRVSCASDCST